MPIQIGTKSGGAGDAADRIPLLEREIGRLRRELEALKGQGGGTSHGLPHWMTTALAAFGVLLGLMALLRH